ncbi:MAG: YfhO family protein [Chloroflexota bacterium]|nr:YfhO family protein [Chloroflexota bacterium]
MRLLRRYWRHPDALALACLALLWLFFFWRLFTPVAADQASLVKGDFSAQFVAFAGYQYQRLSGGEIPLWNPYNNGGLPFVGDTQAAVFYPPRWITIALSSLADGWTYHALQLEMTAHVLIYSLLMYFFLRRLTLGQRLSPLAALAGAIVIAYGGYTGSYPPLQLAILEAAIWFPLACLGILEATRRRKLSYPCVALAGAALGLSWLAGHPQTSWFMTYVLCAYFAYRSYRQKIGPRALLLGGISFGLVAFSVSAVTLLPGIEYLLHTSRAVLGFEQKGNGFPIQDVAQIVFPGSVSQWSPLYIGLPSLFFIAVAFSRNAGQSRFWLAAAAAGLIWSFGANTPIYDLAYNLVPGARFFRGQERAAFLVANSLAIAVAFGVVAAGDWPNHFHRRRALLWWRGFAALVLAVALGAFVLWMGDNPRWSQFFNTASRSAAIMALSAPLLFAFARQPHQPLAGLALIALIALDLFSVSLDHPGTYDPIPHAGQLTMTPPPLVQTALNEPDGGQPFRVDGFRGLGGNFGSLYGIMDMRGISPLFLEGPYQIIHRDYVNNPLAWELFAVKYVYSGSETLSVPSTVVAAGNDSEGAVYAHLLDDPRPFVHLVYHADVVDSDGFARALMDDPRYDPRGKVVLHSAPKLDLPNHQATGTAIVKSYQEEAIDIEVDSADNAIVSIAQPHYVGWTARLNGEPAEILRAYGGLSAVEIPAGQHTLQLRYNPLSYAIGFVLSGFAWLSLALLAVVKLLRR